MTKSGIDQVCDGCKKPLDHRIFHVLDGKTYCVDCVLSEQYVSAKPRHLYKVTLTGFRGSKYNYGNTYVVATDPETAYQRVKQYLVDEELGFESDRELVTVELIASSDGYSYKPMILY
jgi:hypothetical protein